MKYHDPLSRCLGADRLVTAMFPMCPLAIPPAIEDKFAIGATDDRCTVWAFFIATVGATFCRRKIRFRGKLRAAKWTGLLQRMRS